MDIIRFVIPEFVAENLKANKTSKKDHSFCNTVSLKKPHFFTYLNSFEIEATNLSQFTNFPANMFLFGVRKNICAAPFSDA